MQALAKNIKGFNIIELLIVIVIVGIISAVAYPNFNEWRKEREVRGATVKIKNAIQAINSQVQRGMYGFVQVYIENNEAALLRASKVSVKTSNKASPKTILSIVTPSLLGSPIFTLSDTVFKCLGALIDNCSPAPMYMCLIDEIKISFLKVY